MQSDQDNSFVMIAPVVNQSIPETSEQRNSGAINKVEYHANMKKFSVKIICPECKQEGTTVISKEIGAATIMIGYLLFLITTIFCFWIPCCVDDCQDTIHRCPNCKAEVGIAPFQIF